MPKLIKINQTPQPVNQYIQPSFSIKIQPTESIS